MARTHGRNGRLYAAVASGGTAQPILFVTQWSLDAKTNRIDVTAQGDSNKVYLADLPDAQGAYQGFLDDTEVDLFTASQDGVARKFYMYPDVVGSPLDYFFGTAFFDFSMSSPVGGANAVSGTWSAATPVQRVNGST